MNNLHIIEDNNLYGLADANNREIVECIYDQIKPLKSGNFMVIKNKMAGVLSKTGKILLHVQPIRLQYIQNIDVFWYRIKDKKVFGKFVDDEIHYLDIDALSYLKKPHVVQMFIGDKWFLYNDNLTPIQTGYDFIVPTDFQRGRSQFYLGRHNDMWGAFRIKYIRKNTHEIIVTTESVYRTSDEVLLALKETFHKSVRLRYKAYNTGMRNEDDNDIVLMI